MIKYKEIPIDDNAGPEQFKVGDRVRVYFGTLSHADSFVIGMELPGVSSDALMIAEAGQAHWKQCRKLEDVKPREIWWCTRCGAVRSNRLHCGKTCTDKNMIKMREVIE